MAVTVASLHVYPVKGLKGVDLREARCTARGLEHDRRWMVVDAAGEFLSQRSHPLMATVWTEIAGDTLSLSAPGSGPVDLPVRPEGGEALRVHVWRSTCDAVAPSGAADELLSECLGIRCRLVYMPDTTERHSNPQYAGQGKLVGFADGYAYLLTSHASLGDLNARLASAGKRTVPMNRFRPNLVVAGGAPFDEDRWRTLRIGEAAFAAAKPCGRCQVTTTDQTTGEVTGAEPLATLSTYRGSDEFGVMFGMNLVSAAPGLIRVGDAVAVE